MITLLRKDFRLNAPATACLVLIYLILPFLVFFSGAVDEERRHILTWETVRNSLMLSAFAGIGMSLLIVPVFGGIAFARERRDRSADFLAAHPVPRSRVLASKILVGVALCALPWLLSSCLAILAQLGDGTEVGLLSSSTTHRENLENLLWLLRVQVMLFGIAWWLSASVRSESIATGVAIVATVLLTIAYTIYRSRLEHSLGAFDAETQANLIAKIVTLTLGLGGFVAGSITTLRRTSP